MITNFQLYLEAKFADVSIFADEIDFETIIKKDHFLYDAELVTKIYDESFNKELNFTWYNTKEHPFKYRVEVRTISDSISEFNEVFEKAIKKLFHEHFKEIAVRMTSDFRTNRIAIKVPDLLAFLILEYNVDNLFEDNTNINVLTIVPTINSQRKINRIFYL